MTINYNDIADYFIGLSNATGDLISPLKLQKIVFYTQALHLARYGNPLFDGKFQAWIHGPVLPELYEQYQKFSWKPIIREDLDENAFDLLEKKLEDKKEILSKVVENYFPLSAYELEKLTHNEEPWQKARLGLAPDQSSQAVIENEWIQNYYGQNN